MDIRLGNKNDCSQAAEIHLKEIDQGFLNQLGEKFLYYFYRAMVNSPNAFLVVVEEKGSLIGFVAGCINLKKFYKEFVRKYWLRSFLIVLTKIPLIKKIIELIKYSKGEEKNLPQAELLAIAVKSQFRGKGIAGQMLERFISEMKNRGLDSFKVIVGQSLIEANKFYQKKGFQFHSQEAVHRDQPSNLYIYKIK